MSGGGYIPPPGGYPTGPETCGNRSDCEPVVRGFAEPLGLLAPVYAFCGALALTLALLLAANARRARRLRRGGTSGGGRERLLPEEGELGSGASAELDGGVRVAGYADSRLGSAAFGLIAAFTLLLVLVYVVLLADFYWACEFTGPDNCCLQGAHPIFGDYNINSKTMLGWWGTTFVWAGCLGYYKSRVRTGVARAAR